MKSSEITFRDILKSIGAKKIAAAVTVTLIALALIFVGVFFLYSFEKNVISLRGQLSARQSASEAESYLVRNAEAIHLIGYNADRMLKEGRSHPDIHDYFAEETKHIRETLDEGNNGVYGCIEGEFIHGDDFDPGPGFVAEERPWYVETMENDADLTYVKPYFDVQSRSIMMTVAYRLSDGVSVVSLDISLDRLQEVTAEIAASVRGNVVMILDSDGDVVVHSDPGELGKKYSEETESLGGVIFLKFLSEGESQFELKVGPSSYIVYFVELEAGWYSVSVINADEVFRPLRIILFSAVLIAIAAIVVIFVIFLSISRKNLIAQTLNVRLSSIADIYVSMQDINLLNDSFRTISANSEVMRCIGEDPGGAQEMLTGTMDLLADEISKPTLSGFIDLSTLDERMLNTNTIVEEFLDSGNKWCRARFIAAERSHGGSLVRVLWVIESIDEEKRRRDRLQYLSETDLMTGVNNRGSGEHKVTKLLNQGVSGMFMLLDADKFKSVSDTFGHEVGDKVLKAIAQSMKTTFRSDDIIMRIGGDEFAAFAPGVFCEEDGRKIIGRLFSRLEKAKVEEIGDRKIFVSVGATLFKEGDEVSFADLYKRADTGTYESKKTEGCSVTFVGE